MASNQAEATKEFLPSRAVQGLDHKPTAEELARATRAGLRVNPNFKSAMSDFWVRNRSCPPHLNCAIRIENISAHATNKEIFQLIREGKVFSFSKSAPVAGRFPNCAARLVFTNRAAAKASLREHSGIRELSSR